MELKATTIIAIFLFLLLATPCLSKGRLETSDMDSAIYEIDYRGPETHTYIPPPKRSGGRPIVHHQSIKAHRKSKGLRAAKSGGHGHGKKING